ncbi:alpha/beta-hydrolase [Decorospora gaudefroyi]|uniref:Alpha/beta-hydrolase n=1 Tax=Decorospora gaudefroyi TaxID=184978 RepID=A0A6A5KKK5_9PLEO|nr:alpha/beta-hydrolase [Decorospora gaudefroyi]
MAISSSTATLLSFISGVWIPATLFCCIPWVQRQMFYLHNFTFFPGKWLTQPERAGFLKNQVVPFRITTTDGERLFAWLIAPLGVYAKNADAFIQQQTDTDVEDALAWKLLRNDPEARLLIYFHGNSATIAQERRTIEYRSYSAGASEHMFVLAFDYRGFGRSTGCPSESGLLDDAEAVVDWALNTCRIPPGRILLLGHSLGTAVVAGIAHRYAINLRVEFASLILCAAFTNAANAFSSYSIGGIVPVLAPVGMFPAFQAWFSRRMVDTWHSDDRLAEMARACSRFHLVLVHAESDQTMPWHETEALFQSTLRAAKHACSDDDSVQCPQVIDLGEAGRQEFWQSQSRNISKTIAKHGGTYSWSTLDPSCRRICVFRLLLGRIAPHPSNTLCLTCFTCWLQRSSGFLR